MLKLLTSTLFRGFAVVIPVIVAVWVIVWLVGAAEGATRWLIELALPPEQAYIPGMGVLLLLAVTFVIGLSMYTWIARSLVFVGDRMLRRIPLFGSVYGPARDFFELMQGEGRQKLGRPVMVEIPGTGIETLGFVTRTSLADLPTGLAPTDADPEEHRVVYVQWSSQIGGYCFVLHRDKIREVDMTIEEGMRWALTAGVVAPGGGGGSDARSAEESGDEGASGEATSGES